MLHLPYENQGRMQHNLVDDEHDQDQPAAGNVAGGRDAADAELLFVVLNMRMKQAREGKDLKNQVVVGILHQLHRKNRMIHLKYQI